MDVVQYSLQDLWEDKDSLHGSEVEGIGHHHGCAGGLCLRWLPRNGGYQAVQVYHLHHQKHRSLHFVKARYTADSE